MKSVMTFILVLVAIALQSISVHAAETVGPMRKATQEERKFRGLEQDCAQAMTELNQCKKDGKALKEGSEDNGYKPLCEDSTSDPGKAAKGNTTNKSLIQNGVVAGNTSTISGNVGESCQSGIDKCKTSCERAKSKAEEVCGAGKQGRQKTEAQRKGKEAAEKMGEYCQTEGQPRADAAKQQAAANGNSQKESNDKGQQSAGSPSGAPPPPAEKPKEEAKKDDKKCNSENAGSKDCPVAVACTQEGGVMNPGCVPPTLSGAPPAVLGNDKPNVKAAEADEDRFPASPDITAP